MNGIPFEKSKNESLENFFACIIYCLFHPDIRNIDKTKEKFSKSFPKNKDDLFELSQKFSWEKRASLVDNEKINDALNDEKKRWLETRDYFQQIGLLKLESQKDLEDLIHNYLEDCKPYLDINKVDENGNKINTITDVSKRLEQINRITKSANENDKVLWERYLSSIGLDSLIDKN